jgi:methylated-DNA-protein-cysteine methyltransferase related protein
MIEEGDATPAQGQSLFPRICEVVQVPRGRVASYGQIAEIVGAGCDARMVGDAMAATPEGRDVPWQRPRQPPRQDQPAGAERRDSADAAGSGRRHLRRAQPD